MTAVPDGPAPQGSPQTPAGLRVERCTTHYQCPCLTERLRQAEAEVTSLRALMHHERAEARRLTRLVAAQAHNARLRGYLDAHHPGMLGGECNVCAAVDDAARSALETK